MRFSSAWVVPLARIVITNFVGFDVAAQGTVGKHFRGLRVLGPEG
jgi:hypothetical protein